MSRVELSEQARIAIARAKILRNYPGSSFESRRRSHAMKRLTGLTWNYERGDLPNEDGFRFFGLMKDATVEFLRIELGDDGCYTVAEGRFADLVAWRVYQAERGEIIPQEKIVNWQDVHDWNLHGYF
jgi:hypothetical protein